ncbi:MAG: 4Fe-4S dicluster domain-containing protein, partial [Planctomycetes bacterium]|nr:4Fe-4S dicluster domain-containing protein [Planctomycetota bacterium]
MFGPTRKIQRRIITGHDHGNHGTTEEENMPVTHSIFREAGIVTIDPSTCAQCGECARICPAEVLRLEETGVQIHAESMFGCIAC